MISELVDAIEELIDAKIEFRNTEDDGLALASNELILARRQLYDILKELVGDGE